MALFCALQEYVCICFCWQHKEVHPSKRRVYAQHAVSHRRLTFYFLVWIARGYLPHSFHMKLRILFINFQWLSYLKSQFFFFIFPLFLGTGLSKKQSSMPWLSMRMELWLQQVSISFLVCLNVASKSPATFVATSFARKCWSLSRSKLSECIFSVKLGTH